MSIPSEEIENAILSWISTFGGLSVPVDNVDSLSDGIALTEIMCQIAPGVFDTSKLNKEAAENWAFKLNNLNYLYNALEKCYAEVLEKVFDKTYVDVIKVSKNEEKEHLYNLVEVVLGAAVQCEQKEYYINAILTLDESCQNALMYLIEKILNRCNQDQGQEQDQPQKELPNESPTGSFLFRGSLGSAGKPDPQMKSLLSKIEELENENHQLGQRVNDLVQERESSKNKVTELMQEVNKKNEEMRSLVIAKEGVLDKLTEEQSNEELKNELKLKDFKLTELANYIEEIKQQHQMEITLIQDELEEQKRKMVQMSKTEGTMEFYKQKYDEYLKATLQLGEMENQLMSQRNKIEELNTYTESLSNKVNVYREKIDAEKTKNISLDIELTRKSTEIDALKGERKRLEALNSDLNDRLNEQSKEIERHERERENSARFGGITIPGQSLLSQEIITNLEKDNELLRKKQGPLVVEDGEAEIIKKENEILKTKCKEIEKDNETLRKVVAKSEDVKYVERITSDNENLKQEVEKNKKAKVKAQNEVKALREAQAKLNETAETVTQDEKKEEEENMQEALQAALEQEKEKVGEEVKTLRETNRRLLEKMNELVKKVNDERTHEKEIENKANDTVTTLKEEIVEKVEVINKLNEQVAKLQATAKAAQTLEEKLENKDTQIKELVGEIDGIKQFIEEFGEQKEEEMKLLTTALHDVAIRNVDLEKEIMSLKNGNGVPKVANKNKGMFNQTNQRV